LVNALKRGPTSEPIHLAEDDSTLTVAQAQKKARYLEMAEEDARETANEMVLNIEEMSKNDHMSDDAKASLEHAKEEAFLVLQKAQEATKQAKAVAQALAETENEKHSTEITDQPDGSAFERKTTEQTNVAARTGTADSSEANSAKAEAASSAKDTVAAAAKITDQPDGSASEQTAETAQTSHAENDVAAADEKTKQPDVAEQHEGHTNEGQIENKLQEGASEKTLQETQDQPHESSLPSVAPATPTSQETGALALKTQRALAKAEKASAKSQQSSKAAASKKRKNTT
jgi:hypothetical protein